MKFFRSCLVLLTLSPLPAFAQPNDATSETAKVGTINITNAREGTATYDDVKGFALITKDVVLTQSGENLAIYAQKVTYLRKKNQASALGQLRILTHDSTISGQSLRANFSERQFTVSGGVVITSHGTDDGVSAGKREEGSRKPIRILCDQVVWDYGKRQTTATGHVHFLQGTNWGIGDKLIYDEAQNIIKLVGSSHFRDDKKRNFGGSEIDLYLDKDIVFVIHSCPKFPEKTMESASTKSRRSKKAPLAFKPPPALPPEMLGWFNAATTPVTTPLPNATESSTSVPSSNVLNDGETKN